MDTKVILCFFEKNHMKTFKLTNSLVFLIFKIFTSYTNAIFHFSGSLFMPVEKSFLRYSESTHHCRL